MADNNTLPTPSVTDLNRTAIQLRNKMERQKAAVKATEEYLNLVESTIRQLQLQPATKPATR